MDGPVANAPTITVTPDGAAPLGAGVKLAPVSLSDLQAMDRELAQYEASDNTLINASAEVLAVCGTLKRMPAGEELQSTRAELARAIIDLKYRVVRLDYPPSVAENLCLLYSIVLDEFILTRPWAQESGWENRTLVADLFGFRDGGDRFYTIADRALMQPKALREFLEIIYIFLKLGYRGKYNQSKEHERDRLIDRIETALNLTPTEETAQPPGRRVTPCPPPRHSITTRSKIILAVLFVAAVAIGAIFVQAETERTLLAAFEDIRSKAVADTEMDFVFSSQTGAVEAVPRR